MDTPGIGGVGRDGVKLFDFIFSNWIADPPRTNKSNIKVITSAA